MAPGRQVYSPFSSANPGGKRKESIPMARGINKVILVGNLGNDPDVKYSQGGSAITTISVATSEQWKDKQTGQMQESAAMPSMIVCAMLAGISVGKNWKWRK